MAKLINILLRKTDPDYPWGFSLGAVPPAVHSIQITWVDEQSLAAEHLEPGDRVLEIEGMDTTMLSTSEVEALLTSPSSKLELLIMKKSKPGQCPKAAAAAIEEMSRTVKTKETVSSTTEEIAKTEILSEDLMKESKIITTEGTLHKQVMETTDFSEEQETNTIWTSNTITKPSKTGLSEHKESTSNKFWSADSSANLQKTEKPAEKLRDVPTARTDYRTKHPLGANEETQSKATKQEPTTESTSSSSQVHHANHQAEGGHTSSQTESKTDTFWTCPPTDLVQQETKKKVKDENLARRNATGSSYISESQIFKSLNNYRDELRKIDPREEKRQFWESCRKGDSIRRFKWGDSIKPSRVSSTTASTECLYDRMDTQPIHVPKAERSRSCEPMENHSPSNPFSKSFNDFQFNPNISTTNPFYNEYETHHQNRNFSSDANFSSNESSAQFTKESAETKIVKTSSCSQGNESFQFPTARSYSPNYEFVGDKQILQQTPKVSSFTEEGLATSSHQEATISKNGTSSQDGAFRPTKAMSKEEFESKCKFFEKATSAPVSCINAKAKGLVEERLKEGSPSPAVVANTTDTALDNSILRSSQRPTETFGNQKQMPATNCTNEVHQPLMKPSDFISRQLKSTTSIEPTTHGPMPKTEISDTSDCSHERCCFDIQNAPKLESTSQSTLSNENKIISDGSGSANLVEPIYENLSYQKHGRALTSNSSCTEQGRNENQNSSILKDMRYEHQEAKSHFLSYNTGLHTYESDIYSGNSNYVSSRASEMQASREERLRESLNKKIEWFFDGMKPKEVQNNHVQYQSDDSSERDFYEKRTFKESSFEKVTRSSLSPYENVESASSREYQEELSPNKKFASRSRTPAGFYDNAAVEDFGKELRATSPLDISLKSFQDIRTRLASLLGGTPANMKCSQTKLEISRGGVDNVEEAFQKLAIQEGIVENTSESGKKSRQSSQIGGNGGGGSPGLNSVDGPPPPPPPMLGNIPSRKLAAEIAPMKKNYEPPAAIQNAMMTKDKKPFTYTPGGLDLAEIRSPRMAKRISRNAHMEDRYIDN